jgi:hypothetical protein
VVGRDLTEAQQAVVFAQRKEVREQAGAVFRRQLPDQDRRTTGDERQAIGGDGLGSA